MTWRGLVGSMAMSLTMFLYAAFVAPHEVLSVHLEPAGTITLPASSVIFGM